MTKRQWWALAGVIALLVLAILAGLWVGPAGLSFDDVLSTLVGRAPDRITQVIVFNVRAPRTITAVLAGAALGITGLQLQTLFGNPLADPYILGVSSGASLGAAAVILVVGVSGAATSLTTSLGLSGNLAITIASAIGAAGVMAIVLILGRWVNSTTLLLIGVMIGYLTSSVVSVLLSQSSPELIASYTRWRFGSYTGVTWDNLQVLVPMMVIGICIAMFQAKSLNALLLGERYAASMGVRVKRTRTGIIAVSSILAGTVTAYCGPIGFLGIAVPHLARGVFGTSNHKILLPVTALLGAGLAVIADVITTMSPDQVLPLNAVNALFGAPVVIWLLLHRRRAEVG